MAWWTAALLLVACAPAPAGGWASWVVPPAAHRLHAAARRAPHVVEVRERAEQRERGELRGAERRARDEAPAQQPVGGLLRRGAPLEQRARGLRRRLVQLALEDPEPLLYHDEPIYRDGVLVGRTTSGAYGHTLGRAIALGYVERDDPIDRGFLHDGAYEIEIAGRRHAAAISLRPFYDPSSERVRG